NLGLIKGNAITTVSGSLPLTPSPSALQVTPAKKSGSKWSDGFSLPHPSTPAPEQPAESGVGIVVENSGGGMTIANNIVKFAAGGGYALFLDNSFILENQSLNSGASGIPGFFVEGDTNLITEPTSNYSGGDGVQVLGNGNTVRHATVIRNGIDGIRVLGGDSNSVLTSSALRNHGDGIENSGGATNTVIQSNISQFNGNT